MMKEMMYKYIKVVSKYGPVMHKAREKSELMGSVTVEKRSVNKWLN